jgi:hypothetical protein
MSCEKVQQFLLDCDWDADQRRHALEILSHAQECPACRAALGQFDALRARLRIPETDRAVPDGGWGALGHRLARASSHRPSRRWLPVAWVAAVLVGALTTYIVDHRTTGPPALTDQEVAQLQFAPDDRTRNTKAFEQVSEFFDHRTNWLLVSDTASDMGVSAEPMVQPDHVLLLRLSMRHDHQVISNADLVIIPGQTANLTLPLSAQQSLHYRIGTSTGLPTQLALLVEIKAPSGSQPIAGLATTLQLQPDQQVSAGQLNTEAGPYDLTIVFAHAALSSGREIP